MTKKDYILIADGIKSLTFPILPMDTVDYQNVLKQRVIDVIGKQLAWDNDRFDWNKWQRYILPEAEAV